MQAKLLIRSAVLAIVMLLGKSTFAQTATGTINAVLINKNGISLVFDSDPGGVALGSNGSSTASVNFGPVSAFGTLNAGVTRPTVTAASYVVQTLFDVQVIESGLNSPSYTLTAQLAAAAPTGLTYGVDAVTLTTGLQTISATGAYNSDVQHTLNLTVSTAAPGSGGPNTGTPLTTTINFTATSN